MNRENGKIITVKVKIPDGPTCYFESGYACQWILKHSSGQRWCRIFGDAKLERSGEKCRECREASKQINY